MWDKKGTIQMSFTFLVMVILGGLMLTVGVKYISNMAGSIMGLSDETSSEMRDKILRELKQNNAKVMLSIPASIEMTRKQKKRDIVVAINNKNPTSKCFCLNTHLLLLDKSLEKSSDKVEPKGDFVEEGGLGWKDANVGAIIREKGDKGVVSRMKKYVPKTCYTEESAKCHPNQWFTGQSGITVMGEEQGSVIINMELPSDPQRAPNGRWAFKVDVCTYANCQSYDGKRCTKTNKKTGAVEPDDVLPCDACDPEMCFPNTNDDEGRYSWYDSKQFFVKIKTA